MKKEKGKRASVFSIIESSRLFQLEDLSESAQEFLLWNGVGRRAEAILLDDFEPLTLIRLTTRTREILLLEIIDPEKKTALVIFFDGRCVSNLGLCQMPLLLEIEGENLYIQYEKNPNQWRTTGFGPLLLIEILEDRPRSKK